MNSANHLSDQQLQEYLDSGSASIDYASHLDQCDLCQNRLRNYVTMADVLKRENVIPPLNINLAAMVSEKVFVPEKQSTFTPESVLYVLSFILPIVVLIVARPLFTSVAFLQVALLVLPVILFLFLSVKESMILARRLRQS